MVFYACQDLNTDAWEAWTSLKLESDHGSSKKITPNSKICVFSEFFWLQMHEFPQKLPVGGSLMMHLRPWQEVIPDQLNQAARKSWKTMNPCRCIVTQIQEKQVQS
jgi:hypothetical protein